MAIWTPNFSEDEQPSISSAVYQALGAASLCWEDMSSTGIFQSDEATEIADGLLRFLREHNSDAKFWEERWREAADQREQMQVERDAARAEAERLRSPEWEAEVRADERAVAQVQACDFHIVQVRWAEAVAAKLVEVICEQDDLIQIVGVDATNHRAAAADMRRERDAARAEVAALREQQAAWAESCARYVSEVLADLRAKVEGLPYRTWVPPHATDCPGRPGKRGICTCGDSLRASDWMLRADVLALLEEAGRG